MADSHRVAVALTLALGALAPVACSPAGGEVLSDGGARFPDARVSDAGRVRNRDASVGRDATTSQGDGGSTLDATSPDADPDAGRQPGHYTWYGEIQPIIQERCGVCHQNPPLFGAPRSLLRYEDLIATNAFGQPVYELVAFRLVASTGAMPPAGQPALTEQERQMILDWAALGAAQGQEPADSGVPEDASEPDGGIELPWADGGSSPSPGVGLRYVDMWAHSPGNLNDSYTAVRGFDGTSYICWGYTVPANPDPNALPESAVAFEPFLNDISHVHHIFAYLVEPNQTVPDGPVDCILGGGGRIMGSWFPGRGDTHLPDGTGVPIPPGSRLNMQIHYDSIPAAGALDMSGIRVLLTQEQGLIPAGEVWAGIDWQPQQGPGDVTLQSVVTNTYDNVSIFTATPHMHARGLRLSLEYRFAADPPNTWRMLNNMDPWDFSNQVLFNIDPPVVLNAGDQLRTTCTWSTANGAILQGQSSQNEMCYYYLYHHRVLGANPPLLPFYNFVGFPQ